METDDDENAANICLYRECVVSEPSRQSLLNALNDQRSEEGLCDVILVADEERFPAHRCILAASSPYFRSMFEAHRFSESTSKEIQLHSVDSAALCTILNMIYTGKLYLDINNVHFILAATDHMLLTDAKDMCREFMSMVLKSHQATHQALRILSSAQLFSLNELIHESDKFIGSRFCDIITSQSFNELSLDELERLLGNEDVETGREEVFWEAASKWIKHDALNRMQHVDKIIRNIRFPLIEPHTLITKILPDELILKSTIGESLIEETTRYQLLRESQSRLQSSQTKPRITSERTIIYCLADSGSFMCFVPHHRRWYSLLTPCLSSHQPVHYTTLNVNSKIYVAGLTRVTEEVGHFQLKTLQRYEVSENVWFECSLPSIIDYTTLLECNSRLYSCSRDGLEEYNMHTDSWWVVSNVRVGAYQFAVTVDCCLYFYNLVEGVAVAVQVDRNYSIERQQILTPTRFAADVLDVIKLPHHEVLISMRSLTGISRKIFNMKTNMWRDAGLYHGLTTIQPRPAVHYPQTLNTTDLWHIVCDRNNNTLYVLGAKSGLADVPAKNMDRTCDTASLDGILPFYSLNLENQMWTRLPCLPEVISVCDFKLCISDKHTSMATC